AKAAARELTVQTQDRLVIALGGSEKVLLLCLLVIDARLAKAFGDIDIMPIDDTGVPARHVIMNSLCQLEQEGISRAIVKPINGLNVVSETDLRPVACTEVLAGLCVKPFEIHGQKRQHARVTGEFEKGLKHVAHYHVRPQVRLPIQSGFVAART